MGEPTAAQRLRARVLVVTMALVAGLGVLARLDGDGEAPRPCATPALADGVLSCDGVGRAPRARAWLAGHKLDVNQATTAELEAIPGIGPSLASAIVSTRARLGGFSAWDALDQVPGVGPKTLEKLARYVEVR